MDTVTVVIPTWNRASLIGRAIDSVLAQELPPGHSLEVIVVDDGSTDSLAEVLQRYEGRVSCVRHERNLGAAAARNAGVAAGTGTFVAFLDSDDTWQPGKLVRQLAVMAANGWKACCTAYYLVQNGKDAIISPRIYRTQALGLRELVWGCFVSPGSTLICEKKLFSEIGPLDSTLRRLEDWDWLLRYVARYELGFLSEPFARINASNPPDSSIVVDALVRIQQNQAGTLDPSKSRNFESAVSFAKAAALYNDNRKLSAIPKLVKSLWLAPNNRALAAILHNHFARSTKV